MGDVCDHLRIPVLMKDGRWFNPDSYQLILPGEDGSYGGVCGHTEHEHEHGGFEPRDANDPDSISLEDWDNITNFTDGDARYRTRLTQVFVSEQDISSLLFDSFQQQRPR